MHYTISIFSPEINKRAFIAITINGVRYREYSGNRINVNIKPNNAKTLKERNNLLKILEYEYKKSLENGSYQMLVSKSTEKPQSTEQLLQIALRQKTNSHLNPHYVQCLARNHNNLIAFLTTSEKQNDINLLKTVRIQDYLDTYRDSPNNYMAKRRELGSLLGYLKSKGWLKTDLIRNTDKLKVKATLHKTYSKNQIREVLHYLKSNHENLYICCLISYGCLLRPHIEIRNLTGQHFKNDCSEIHLSGAENKSGRIRVVCIPTYVREVIYDRVSKLQTNENLFSLTNEPFNEYYFKTTWSRLFKKMLSLNLVEKNQTMYSFRHTAAVNVYKKTKDLHILQQLLGHSDMIVTLKYLRGLGVHNMNELEHSMPEL